MDKVIYNSITKEISKEDLSTKLVETLKKGKVYKDYQGWSNAVIYDVEELKKIGKPENYAVPVLIRFEDGSIDEIYTYSFYKSPLDEKDENKRPWFGKLLPLKGGKKGVHFRILDLETGKVVEEKEHNGSISFLDKDYYSVFVQDWDAFDEFGGYDESMDYLKRDGVVVLKTPSHIQAQYDKDGQFIGVKIGSTKLSKEDIDARYKANLAKANLIKAVKEIQEAGAKPEDIEEIVRSVVGPKVDAFNID